MTTDVGERAPRNRYFQRRLDGLAAVRLDGREGEMRDAELRDVLSAIKYFIDTPTPP